MPDHQPKERETLAKSLGAWNFHRSRGKGLLGNVCPRLSRKKEKEEPLEENPGFKENTWPVKGNHCSSTYMKYTDFNK